LDEVVIKTKLGKFLLKKFLEGVIQKALGRNVDISMGDVRLAHNDGEKVSLHVSGTVNMTEAEFRACLEQLIGG